MTNASRLFLLWFGCRRISVAAGVVLAMLCLTSAHADPPQLLWRKKVDLGGYGYASAIAANPDGDVVVAGPTGGSFGGPNRGDTDIFVAVFSADGTLRLRRHPGTREEDSRGRVAIDTAGNVVVAGSTYGSLAKPNEGYVDGFVVSYSSAGAVQWRRQPASRQTDWINAVALDDAGAVVVAGQTDGWLAGPRTGPDDAFVVKYAAGGAEQWGHQLGITGSDAAMAVAVDAAGNVAVAGRKDSSLLFLVKYAADGTELWRRKFGPAMGTLDGVAIDAAGNIVVAGVTTASLGGPNNGAYDALVAAYSPDGRLLWTQQPGTSNDDWPYGVRIEAGTGNVILGWRTNDGNMGVLSFFSVYSPAGALLGTLQLPAGWNDEQITQFTIDSSGNIYTSGELPWSGGNAIFFVNKYAPLSP